MGKIAKIIVMGAASAILALMIMAFQTPPETAMSNAGKWMETVAGAAPLWMQPESIDNWATVILSMVLGGLLLATAQVYQGKRFRRSGFGKIASTLDPSASDAVEEARPLTQGDVEPRPSFHVAASDEFPYPYPKAVLKAEIRSPRGTLEKHSGAEAPHKMIVKMVLINDHTAPLKDCSVFLKGYFHEGKWFDVSEPMRGEEKFTVHKSSTLLTAQAIISRDISDRITPQPFLLRLSKRSIPLLDNATYTLKIELRSRYPLATLLTVQIDTGTGLDAEAKITRIELAKEEKHPIPPENGPTPSRDVKLAEALAYAITGEWGRTFVSAMGDNLANGDVVSQARQKAHDGVIRIWGKRTASGVFEEIPPEYWRDYQPDLFSLMRETPSTERTSLSVDHSRYIELMASKYEFEREWPPQKQ